MINLSSDLYMNKYFKKFKKMVILVVSRREEMKTLEPSVGEELFTYIPFSTFRILTLVHSGAGLKFSPIRYTTQRCLWKVPQAWTCGLLQSHLLVSSNYQQEEVLLSLPFSRCSGGSKIPAEGFRS